MAHSEKTITFAADLLPNEDDTYKLGDTGATWKIFGNVTGDVNGSASKLGTATLGTANKPIYLSSGVATLCNAYAGGTVVTLNGTSKAESTASFYAPTGAGTAGEVLVSTAGVPGWYGGISLTGTDAGTWIATFNGTSAATISDTGVLSGSVVISGGLAVNKTAIIGKIKIGNGTTDLQKRTISVTDTNLVFDVPSGQKTVFQTGAASKIIINGNIIHPYSSSTTASLGSLGTSDIKWANVYATTFNGNLIGNVTGNVSGSSGSCTGNAATATALASSVSIWGNSFDGSSDIGGHIKFHHSTARGEKPGANNYNSILFQDSGEYGLGMIANIYETATNTSRLELLAIKPLTVVNNTPVNKYHGIRIYAYNVDEDPDTLGLITTDSGSIVQILNTTNATTTSDGALRVDGGISVANDIYMGGRLTIANTSAGAIYLTRSSGPNWIWSNTQSIAFCSQCNTLSPSKAALRILIDTVDGYTDNYAHLGSSSVQWVDVHSYKYLVQEKVTLQYNTTDDALEFVFA